PVTCTANKNGSQAECELGNPFKRDSKVTFYIILSTAGISLNTSAVEVDLQLQTYAQPSQVSYTGKVKGESAMKTETDIGSAIKYQFRIINLGKPLTDFGAASLVVQWPKETTDGKWLLYLTDISSTGVKKVNCSPGSEVNPLGVKKTCDNGAACVEFHCPLQGLDSNAAVTMNARLWNSTFIEEFSKLNYLDIVVKASLRVVSAGKNMVVKNGETQVKVTVFPEIRAHQYGGLPWWIILVAILLGLLLLALLIFLLWKCGFFERTKYEDSVPSYNAVRIKRAEREGKAEREERENREKKPWITSWTDNEHYS
ncbi:hypothetical protein CRUP_020757, partial [Coryphaenoides rupestris]